MRTLRRSPLSAERPAECWSRSPRPWLWLSVGAAAVAISGSVVGLAAVDAVYARTSESLTNQAIAQDLVNVAIVSPLMLVLAFLAMRGSLSAYLAWLGTLLFTVYNYAIYGFAVPFGPLFIVWVAVLGLATYALIGGIASVDPAKVRGRVSRPSMRPVAWFLIAVAGLFGLLWLADIARALASGAPPAAVTEMGIPTNPVHVLDLALFLPAAVIVGVLLLRERALAYVLGPGMLLFLALTGLPILTTPLVAGARDDEANWSVAIPIAIITAVSLLALGRMLAGMTSVPRARL